ACPLLLRVLCSFPTRRSSDLNCLVARLFEHDLLLGLAKHASVPVVNALTDASHPCQILADMYTIRQHGKLQPGMKVAFIGDGNKDRKSTRLNSSHVKISYAVF